MIRLHNVKSVVLRRNEWYKDEMGKFIWIVHSIMLIIPQHFTEDNTTTLDNPISVEFIRMLPRSVVNAYIETYNGVITEESRDFWTSIARYLIDTKCLNFVGIYEQQYLGDPMNRFCDYYRQTSPQPNHKAWYFRANARALSDLRYFARRFASLFTLAYFPCVKERAFREILLNFNDYF